MGDALFFPSIIFSDGGAEGSLILRVIGRPEGGGPAQGFLIEFHHVEAVCGYSETVYWSFADAIHRPQHCLNIIESSMEPSRMAELGRTNLVHYLLCGGDMCCEIVASDRYVITTFDSEDALEREAVRRREAELSRIWP